MGEPQYFQIFNSYHTNKIINKDKNKIIIHNIEFLKKIGKLGFRYNKRELYRYIIVGFDFIIKECNKQEITNLVNQYKYDFVLNLLELEDSFSTAFIPDYKQMLEQNGLKSQDTIERVKEGFRNLLRRTLITKNRVVSFFLFDKLKEIVMLYSKSDRQEQEEFIGIYEDVLYYGVFNKEPENFHLILKQFQDLFLEMDKEDKISHDLCLRFINIYKELNIITVYKKLIEFAISINHNLNEMKDKSRLINKKTELLLEVNKAFFATGMKGVENGVDDIIRNVSNKLGWIGKEAIDNNNNDEFKINESTIIFNGTLFIILGAYATYKRKLYMAKCVKDAIYMINCASKLYASKLIRVYESEHWDEVMGGNAGKYMEEFYNNIMLNSVI